MPKGEALIQFEQEHALTQVIMENTRGDNRLDLCLTNCDIIKDTGVLDENLSDHYPIFILRKKVKEKYFNTEFVGRSYRRYVKEEFQNALTTFDWHDFYYSRDPNACWDIMCAIMHTELNKTCPIRKMKIREKKLPWISRGIVEQLADKNRARAKSRKSRLDVDKTTSNKLQNKAKNAVRDAKSYFIQDNENEDRFKFWDKMEYLIPSKAKSKPINLISPDTHLPVPQNHAAELINNFFVNIGPTLADNFGDVQQINFVQDPYPPLTCQNCRQMRKKYLTFVKKSTSEKPHQCQISLPLY